MKDKTTFKINLFLGKIVNARMDTTFRVVIFRVGNRESRKEAGIMGEQWTHGPIMVRQMPLKGPSMQHKNGRK